MIDSEKLDFGYIENNISNLKHEEFNEFIISYIFEEIGKNKNKDYPLFFNYLFGKEGESFLSWYIGEVNFFFSEERERKVLLEKSKEKKDRRRSVMDSPNDYLRVVNNEKYLKGRNIVQKLKRQRDFFSNVKMSERQWKKIENEVIDFFDKEEVKVLLYVGLPIGWLKIDWKKKYHDQKEDVKKKIDNYKENKITSSLALLSLFNDKKIDLLFFKNLSAFFRREDIWKKNNESPNAKLKRVSFISISEPSLSEITNDDTKMKNSDFKPVFSDKISSSDSLSQTQTCSSLANEEELIEEGSMSIDWEKLDVSAQTPDVEVENINSKGKERKRKSKVSLSILKAENKNLKAKSKRIESRAKRRISDLNDQLDRSNDTLNFLLRENAEGSVKEANLYCNNSISNCVGSSANINKRNNDLNFCSFYKSEELSEFEKEWYDPDPFLCAQSLSSKKDTSFGEEDVVAEGTKERNDVESGNILSSLKTEDFKLQSLSEIENVVEAESFPGNISKTNEEKKDDKKSSLTKKKNIILINKNVEKKNEVFIFLSVFFFLIITIFLLLFVIKKKEKKIKTK